MRKCTKCLTSYLSNDILLLIEGASFLCIVLIVERNVVLVSL